MHLGFVHASGRPVRRSDEEATDAYAAWQEYLFKAIFRVEGKSALPALERAEEGRFRVIAGHHLQADAAAHRIATDVLDVSAGIP